MEIGTARLTPEPSHEFNVNGHIYRRFRKQNQLIIVEPHFAG
ncbi:uncharacterized protein METZ01_LOCUS407436 [marine metagenome]|uniref:Uncharacterized protein n=1 Tax=marine metagenome TaxID=408172 RepID=A0A382W6Y7_9ZZZZ